MAKRLKEKQLRVKVNESLVERVSIGLRDDFHALVKRGVVLVIDDGSEMFRLVEPQGLLHSLRKSCVTVLSTVAV